MQHKIGLFLYTLTDICFLQVPTAAFPFESLSNVFASASPALKVPFTFDFSAVVFFFPAVKFRPRFLLLLEEEVGSDSGAAEAGVIGDTRLCEVGDTMA